MKFRTEGQKNLPEGDFSTDFEGSDTAGADLVGLKQGLSTYPTGNHVLANIDRITMAKSHRFGSALAARQQSK